MTTQHGRGLPPSQPWRSRLADLVQIVAVVVAIAAALVYFEIRVGRMHADVVRQIDRVEAGVGELVEFAHDVEAKSEANRRRIEAVEGDGGASGSGDRDE